MGTWGKLDKSGASSILMILMVSAVAVAVTFQVASRIVQRTRINEGSGKTLSRELALRSALEYTKYALKNRWCMTNVWVQDPNCASNFVYALTHPRGLERLLLTEDETNAIWLAMQHLPPGTPNPLANATSLRLGSIEQTVAMTSLNALNFSAPANGGLGENHPLRTIVMGLNKAAIGALTFKLTRIVNNQNPDPPNWIRMKARVSSDSGAFVEETFLLSAVEVGTYALLMSGAMNLTGETATGSQFDVPTTATKTGTGLHFLSPVFLNGNLVIPDSSVTNRYANVTFHDKVVLAPLPPIDTISQGEKSGLLMTLDSQGDLKPFAPASFGGLGDSSYKDAKNFGGLLQGVELQSASDWGAFYLFDSRSDGVDPNVLRANMNVCIRRNQALGDLSVTNPAVFILKKDPGVIAAANPEFKYFLALSNDTNFYAATRLQTEVLSPQDQSSYPMTESINGATENYNQLSAGAVDDNWDEFRRPVLKVTARLKGRDPANPLNTIILSSTTAQLSRESTLTIPLFSVGRTSFLQLENGSAGSQSTLNARESTLDSRFSSLRNAIFSFNSALNANGLSPAVPNVPNSAPQQGGSVNVGSSQAYLDAVQTAINGWQPAIAAGTPSPNPSPSPSPAPSLPASVLNSFATLETKYGDAVSALADYQAALAARASAEGALDAATNANHSSNRPKIKIKLRPNRLDILNLSVKFENSSNLSALLEDIEIEFYACEIGTTRHCENLRTISTAPYSATGLNVGAAPRKILYSVSGAAYSRTVSENPPSPYSDSNWTTLNGVVIPETTGVIHTPPPAVDPQVIDEMCNGSSGSRLADKFTGDVDPPSHLVESFSFAGFNYDFTGGARTSWDFKPVHATVDFDSSMEGDFHIYGIIDSCKIKSSMRFFAGLVVCKELEIESRTQSLDIVGTVIAGKVTVHSSAISKGITWSSIYHPSGVRLLRKKGLLRSGVYDASGNEVSCATLSTYVPGADAIDASYPANPIWNPNPNLRNYAATIRCSPMSLREKSHPFSWNSLEPLCGIRTKPDGTYENKTTCRPRRPMVFTEILLGRSESQ